MVTTKCCIKASRLWGISRRCRRRQASNPKPRLKSIIKRGKNPKMTCHQYIGRVNSSTGLGTEPQVTKAYQECENRKRLDAVDKALEQIKAALIEVMPE